jgi:hypothetical protein
MKIQNNSIGACYKLMTAMTRGYHKYQSVLQMHIAFGSCPRLRIGAKHYIESSHDEV